MGGRMVLLALAVGAVAAPLSARQDSDPRALMAAPIVIEREQAVATVPLALRMGKLELAATLDGTEGRFIFDTGSPSMISRQLAEELGLDIIGANTGTDANGRAVTTGIAVIERLELGGVMFHDVPVLVFDFAAVDPRGCLFDGGVIGSELFPGSAWQVDTEAMELRIAADAARLHIPQDSTISARLEDFGYPHAPVFTYAIGALEDRGLFDTGSPDTLTLFRDLLEDERVASAVVAGSLSQGRGSEGTSAGGVGAETDLARFELAGFRLGETGMAALPATTRGVPPTLLGAGLLQSYLVTLDYPGGRMLLTPREHPEVLQGYPGYALSETADGVRVSQLFAGSPAAQAGLQLGDEVVAINDREVGADPASCNTMQWLVEERPTAFAFSLTVQRAGVREVLVLAD